MNLKEAVSVGAIALGVITDVVALSNCVYHEQRRSGDPQVLRAVDLESQAKAYKTQKEASRMGRNLVEIKEEYKELMGNPKIRTGVSNYKIHTKASLQNRVGIFIGFIVGLTGLFSRKYE